MSSFRLRPARLSSVLLPGLAALTPLCLLALPSAAAAFELAQPTPARSSSTAPVASVPAGALPTGALQPASSPAAGLALDLRPLRPITGLPPLPGSNALEADLAVLRWLQRNRTPEMVAATWTLLARQLEVFSPALGVDMNKTTPVLIGGVQAFLGLVDDGSNALKEELRRPRPYTSHPDLTPCLPPELGYSFPSGHASWYAAAAELLADLLPERRDRILELGSHGGASRVMCGVHYPSDVMAAQRFAQAAARQIIASPQWQRFRSDRSLQAELQAIRAASPLALPLLVR